MIILTAILLTIRQNQVVDSARLIGEKEATREKAEKTLIELAREHLSNFDEYTQDDIDACVKEGAFRTLTGSVSMVCFEDNLSILSSLSHSVTNQR